MSAIHARACATLNDLDGLLRQANFVTLHVPLMPEARHLINDRTLGLMQPGSYLINASRGPVVDEAALIRALQSGHLAAAGLDVFDPEPPLADNPLLTMKNVVVTPHIASSTDRGVHSMMHGVADQIIQPDQQ
ncbi:MAG: NAD(P)-dependent oxidoreductase [Caldilineaceae bacterium]